MVVLEAIQDFTLQDFDKINIIERKTELSKDDPFNKLHVGDTFETDKDMAEYLTGNNTKNLTVAKILEIKKEEEKPKKKK